MLTCIFIGMPVNAAVVLLYHHVSSDTPPSTSVSPGAFLAHLEYLQEQNFAVLHLTDILAAMRNGTPLPKKTVAITFDDAYQSVHDTAMPMLAARGWPFTVFVNTEATSTSSSLYMDWGDLRRVLAAGGDVQNHSHRHGYLAYPVAGETPEAWRDRVLEDIEIAQSLIQTHLGTTPTLFAYPYGEYSPGLEKLVEASALMGIGQHSGAVGAQSDFFAIPRHPFYAGADGLERFKTRVHTEPLYITVKPKGPMRVRPTSRVTLHLEAAELDKVSCFFDGRAVNIEGDQLRDLGPFAKRRTKLNCTKSLGAGRFQWWSYLFIRP